MTRNMAVDRIRSTGTLSFPLCSAFLGSKTLITFYLWIFSEVNVNHIIYGFFKSWLNPFDKTNL